MESSYDSFMAVRSFLPYRMGYLTDYMVKKAEEELNENEENRQKALAELRRMIANDKALHVWTDDAYLLQFLRARKFDVKKSWECFHTFFILKRDFPEVFPIDFDFVHLRNLGETNIAGAYNYRNKDGSVVLYVQARHWDPELYPFKTILIALTALFLAAVDDPATQVCGVHIIVDTKEFSWKHLRTITPKYVMLLGKGLRKAFPVRIKGIHILNEPVIFTHLINILKMFLSEKIVKRIHFHGSNMENLHKYISKDILPPEYGGVNADYSGKDWCSKELDLFIDRFRELLCKGYC